MVFVGVVEIFIVFIVIVWVSVVIFGENVVENNKVWCFVGNNFKICLILWIKFIFSIWFVLLSINILSWLNFIVFCWNKFSKWSGVVISIFILECSVFICGLMFILLNIMVVFSERNVLNLWMLFFICVVNFWVGVKISVFIWLDEVGLFDDSLCNIGKENFVVLLVLVCVVVNMFLFLSISGIVCFWMGDGDV